MLKDEGIRLTSFNMVGVPFETKDTILETIKTNAKLAVDLVQSTIFFPYKGTRLFDLCLEQNLIDQDKVVTDYYTSTKLKNEHLKSYEIVAYKRSFKFLVPLYKKLYNCFGEDSIIEKCLDFTLKSRFVTMTIYLLSEMTLYIMRYLKDTRQ